MTISFPTIDPIMRLSQLEKTGIIQERIDLAPEFVITKPNT